MQPNDHARSRPDQTSVDVSNINQAPSTQDLEPCTASDSSQVFEALTPATPQHLNALRSSPESSRQAPQTHRPPPHTYRNRSVPSCPPSKVLHVDPTEEPSTWIPRADSGTPYPCTTSHINLLRDRQRKSCTQSGQLTLEEALARFVHFSFAPLHTKEQLDALQRLQDLKHLTCEPDVIFKIFDDFDTVFFDGQLHGNVCLEYFETFLGGEACTNGADEWSNRVSILLNVLSFTLGDATLHDVITNLMHEMVHAYLRVLCEPHADDSSDKFGHGYVFWVCIDALEYKLGGAGYANFENGMERLETEEGRAWVKEGHFKWSCGDDSAWIVHCLPKRPQWVRDALENREGKTNS